jgi:DinB superfamily
MPVSNRITVAAQSFNRNDSFLRQSVQGLSDEDWLLRLDNRGNHLLWIVGHVAWARTMLPGRLGAAWTTPWMGLYARGAKCVESPECPSPRQALTARGRDLHATERRVDRGDRRAAGYPAATKGPPSADGKLSGMVNFLAFHETYHVGQAAYLGTWLGRTGPMG